MTKLLYLFFFFLSFLGDAQFDNPQLQIIDILKYDFEIQINDQNDTITGFTKILFKRKVPAGKLILNFKNIDKSGFGMQVKTVVDQNGSALSYKHQNDLLEIEIPYLNKQPDTLQLNIRYSGKPADGLYIRHNKYGKRTFFGDNWPNRAQYWLPVIDHPSDKALVSWTVTAPKHYDVIASGRFVSKISRQQTNTFHYQTKVPIPTKVMVFGAADFNIKNFEKTYLTEKCVPVSSWIYQDSPVNGFDDYQCAVPIIKFYDSLIGPYAYEKLANVQSKTRFGGMENAGNIFYDENTVDGTKSVENLVAHEVAHQWFGNTLTEKNWRDIWLSEGFATYLTDLYLEHKYGTKKLMERMAMERQKVLRYNSFKSKPIVFDETQNLFRLLNPNSYEKGAWVLHQLRTQIGDKNFFKLLRVFYKKYYLKNAGTDDFKRLAEQISKQKLDWFFEQWLYRSGIPKLQITKSFDAKHHLLKIHITQKNDTYKLNLPVLISTGNDKISKMLKINEKEENFDIKIPKNSDADNLKLILDPKVQVLFKMIN